jgi:hypothetical protein
MTDNKDSDKEQRKRKIKDSEKSKQEKTLKRAKSKDSKLDSGGATPNKKGEIPGEIQKNPDPSEVVDQICPEEVSASDSEEESKRGGKEVENWRWLPNLEKIMKLANPYLSESEKEAIYFYQNLFENLL